MVLLSLVGVLMLMGSREARAQATGPLWRPAAAPANRGAAGKLAPGHWFTLDAPQLAARLAAAPPETRPAAAVALELPYPDGTLHRFALTQVPVMAPALAARYPQIRTYAGRGLDDPAATVRLETAPAGLHAQVLRSSGAFSVQADPAAPDRYLSRADTIPEFDCRALAVPGRAQGARDVLGGTPPLPPAAYGSQLRTLRLAMAATGEYTTNLGGGTVAGTMASMVTLVSQLNAVYERDLALRLELVPNNNLVIYTDPATDPFDNANPVNLMNANTGVLNAALGGASAYDLGHVLSYRSGGYSGVAYVGVVCYTPLAGGGASTGASAGLMATVLTHEIGHQLGSGHTFNGERGNCAGGNRSPELAFEPGAGNTIMSYDSRCDPDNVGPKLVYFHAASLSVIMPELTCGVLTATGNRPPSLAVPANGYTIPQGTPFALAGTGTDPDNDALVYSWEQLDRGTTTSLADAATDASGPPLFRSLAPAGSPARTFPALASILNGSNPLANGEILPLVARTLNFRLTARDNRGGVAGANLSLAVAATGPFAVTSPAAAFTAAPGSAYAVTWSVNGSDQAPVSAPSVQILFSADGGLTFPTVLLASTPNDGAATVTLPLMATTRGRLKIRPLNNVFFAISGGNITLVGTPLPVELTAFTAEARGAATHLTWTTASEKNNTGFAVEVSADGTAFRRVGWVPGQGTSTQPRGYTFDDGTLATYPGPTAYYRLRQIDGDNTETFSPVRTVAVPAGLAAQLQVWPNPARGAVTIAGLPPGQPVQVFDLTGRLRLTATVPPSGPLELVLPGNLSPGVYVVRGGGQARRLVVE